VPKRKEFCRQLRDRLEAQPGVEAVSYSDLIPLGTNESWEDLQIEGYVPGPNENMKLYRNVVAPGYFSLLRIPLIGGRDFTEHDDESSNPVMIVTQTFAQRFFPRRDPLGHKVHGWGQWFTIVGVARDSKYHSTAESNIPPFLCPLPPDLSRGSFHRLLCADSRRSRAGFECPAAAGEGNGPRRGRV